MKNENDLNGGYEKRTIHNLIILDESGSMEAIKKATIAGFNEVVQTIKGVEQQFPEQEHFISLVTFNGLGIKTILFNVKVRNLKKIDGETFQPDASTPLFDAVGFSVNKLRRETETLSNCNVLVTIFTDSEENASEEYSGAAIKKLIDQMKKRGWTFTYIGANHDVERVARSLSIPNSLKFDADEAGIEKAFAAEKKSRGTYAMKLRRNDNVQACYYEDESGE